MLRLCEHIGNSKGQDIDNNRCYYGERYSEQERMEERPVSENALIILQPCEPCISHRPKLAEA